MAFCAKICHILSMADKFRTAPDWGDLRTFCALSRNRSLSATARALSVNHATIARRVSALENAIGEKLVERRPDGYVLTAEGRRVFDIALAMETAASALASGGDGGLPSGLVRINATPSLAQGFLVKRLGSFVVSHPRIDIELATDTRSVSLERHEADIALRLTKPLGGDVLAKPLVSIGFAFYASPDRLKRLAADEAPVFIGFDEANAHLPEAVWLARQFPHARVSLRAGSQIAQAEAAKSGCGIALLPHFVGRADAGLAPCQLGKVPPFRTLWIVTRRRDKNSPTIRMVVDFLLAGFAQERSLFEGD